MNINEEKELRSIIRHYIGLVKEKRLNEEKDLRSIIGAGTLYIKREANC